MALTRILTLTALALCACRSSSKQHEDDKYSSYDSYRSTTEAQEGGTTMEASAQRAPSTTLSAADREFLVKAAADGMFEVEISQLALQKSVSGEHRDFAKLMVEDHGRTNRELEMLAMNKRVDLPRDLDAKHAQELADLRQLDGKDFERRFHECQTKAHEDAVALFERAARETTDLSLKSFAQKVLPTLREHQRELQKTVVASPDDDV